MKFRLLILFFCLIGTFANAQTAPTNDALVEYQFVPMKLKLSSYDVPIASFSEPSNKLINFTGWFLHQLKFRSVLDEFNAIAPFDERAFHPTSVSNFNSSLSRSYLLLNTHPSFYDR